MAPTPEPKRAEWTVHGMVAVVLLVVAFGIPVMVGLGVVAHLFSWAFTYGWDVLG